MKPHPSDEVNRALIALNDAILRWERDTMRDTALIVKSDNWHYRSLNGKPCSDCISDDDILSCVEG